MMRLRAPAAPENFRSTPRRRRTYRSFALTVLLAGAIAGLIGCGGKAPESTPAVPEPATSGTVESAPGGTSTIALNWDPQNNCVNFVPQGTTINLGDRVNFTTSVEGGVTVNVPAGLFSAGDTTITVNRGANEASPTARMAGTFELSSNPAACATTAGGGGPFITVNEGTSNPKP